MKTENVYVGRIYKVSSCSYDIFGRQINLDYVKSAVMVRKSVMGFSYMKDLETGQRYSVKLSSKKGTLYVSQTYLEEFNYATRNHEMDLPKEKILKLGKEYLNM